LVYGRKKAEEVSGMKKIWQYAMTVSVLCIAISFLYPLFGAIAPSMPGYGTLYLESKMIWITLVGCAWLVVSAIMGKDDSPKDNK
jgi:hypothetical protein